MANICIDCANACGGCPWSEIDQETGKPKFEPVPGWTAIPVRRRTGTDPRGKVMMDTYHIIYCPLFKPDSPRKLPVKGNAF